MPEQNDVPWYFCCLTCDAKFFNDTPKCECQRCGAELTSNERIQPPWQKKLLTIKEASQVLSISQSKLYELVERKEICHRRIGGAIRFADADIVEFLESAKRDRKCAEARPVRTRPEQRKARHERSKDWF